MISRIRAAYIRHYRDNGQTTAYVEWSGYSYGKPCDGRTEGPPGNWHMQALLARAKREGIRVERQTW